jgi:carbamate kinase
VARGEGRIAVVAVGGNSLIKDTEHQSIPDQDQAARETVRHVVDFIAEGWRVVITHGNGPQVGFELRRSELAMSEVPPIPMDYAGAEVQGSVGYMFQKAFHNEFLGRGLPNCAIALVTEVLVDATDPAFAEPTKPIGAQMSEERARRIAAERGWTVREDAGRGWRRVVPSPAPREIVELDAIVALLRQGFTVVACGGGGIPVVRRADGRLEGVEAVIDKDLASSLLARAVGADLFVISTAVEKVALDYNTSRQRPLDRMTASEARRYLAAGHFLAGSMGPKVRAMVDYLEGRGERGGRGLITSPENLGRALAGRTGTHFEP